MAYVGSMISRPPVTVDRSTTIATAAREMARTGVGALLVIDDDRLVGIVTDRDIVVRGIARGVASDGRIDALMTTEVVTIPAGMGVERAYEIFRSHSLRRLPILDGRRLVGVVTIDLLVRSEREMSDLVHPLRDEAFAPRREPAPPVKVGAASAEGAMSAKGVDGTMSANRTMPTKETMAAKGAVSSREMRSSSETGNMTVANGGAIPRSAVFPRRTGVLRAHRGDILIVHSHVPRTADRSGEICEVHSEAGDPPFAVRWTDTRQVSFVFPGPDAEVRHPDGSCAEIVGTGAH